MPLLGPPGPGGGGGGGLRAAASCAAPSRSAPPCARAVQEKPHGPVAEAWLKCLADSGLATVDVSQGLGLAMSAKDDDEVMNIKKAGHLVSSAVTNFAVPEIEGESTACTAPPRLARVMHGG